MATTNVKSAEAKKPKASVQELLQALSNLTTSEVGSDTCEGTGKKATGNPKKTGYPSYTTKYKCPSCQGYYAKDPNGNLNKHKPAKNTAKAATEKRIRTMLKNDYNIGEGFCAGCSEVRAMAEDDFLCVACRSE